MEMFRRVNALPKRGISEPGTAATGLRTSIANINDGTSGCRYLFRPVAIARGSEKSARAGYSVVAFFGTNEQARQATWRRDLNLDLVPAPVVGEIHRLVTN